MACSHPDQRRLAKRRRALDRLDSETIEWRCSHPAVWTDRSVQTYRPVCSLDRTASSSRLAAASVHLCIKVMLVAHLNAQSRCQPANIVSPITPIRTAAHPPPPSCPLTHTTPPSLPHPTPTIPHTELNVVALNISPAVWSGSGWRPASRYSQPSVIRRAVMRDSADSRHPPALPRMTDGRGRLHRPTPTDSWHNTDTSDTAAAGFSSCFFR